MHPIGSFLIDPERSDFPVICVEHFTNNVNVPRMLLSKVEFRGDYYTSTQTLVRADIDISTKMAVLGKFGHWFLKIHRDIVVPIMVEFALTVLDKP
jgi:hypothetical protein